MKFELVACPIEITRPHQQRTERVARAAERVRDGRGSLGIELEVEGSFQQPRDVATEHVLGVGGRDEAQRQGSGIVEPFGEIDRLAGPRRSGLEVAAQDLDPTEIGDR